MKRLGVNIDHIATLRNARGEKHPDPLYAAKKVISYGADSVTIHLREDRRHIKDFDAKKICGLKNVPVNLEISMNKEIEVSEKIATILDISHAFTSIEIKGDNSTLFLNRHLPIDLRTKNFPNLSSASTAIHHVSVKLLKISSNIYCLYIPRGFALSIWEILLETADQFGYEVLDR